MSDAQSRQSRRRVIIAATGVAILVGLLAWVADGRVQGIFEKNRNGID
jgi:hypothetical protein